MLEKYGRDLTEEKQAALAMLREFQIATQLIFVATRTVNDHEIGQARDELVRAMGPAAAVRAFAVAGNFEMMNRLLDGQGVLPGVAGRSIGDEIGYPFVDHHGNEDLVSSR